MATDKLEGPRGNYSSGLDNPTNWQDGKYMGPELLVDMNPEYYNMFQEESLGRRLVRLAVVSAVASGIAYKAVNYIRQQKAAR